METTDPRHAVEVALATQRLNQAELASRLDIFPSVLSRTLKENQMLSKRSHWAAILDALGLEVVIRPKQAQE